MSAPQSVPTMAIVHPDGEARGPLVINASDFDPATHVRWSDRDPATGRFESTHIDPDAGAPDAPKSPGTSSKRGSKS